MGQQTINRFDPDDVKSQIEMMKAELFFPSLEPPQNIQVIMKQLSDLTVLKSLSPMDLSEYSVLLDHYGLFLTTQENRLKSYLNWCESNIKYIVGKNIDKSYGYGFNEKDAFIRSNDMTAHDLEFKKLGVQAKLDTIQFMSLKISRLSDTVHNLAVEKHKFMKGI